MAEWDLLQRLCAAYGVSGQEDAVRDIILKEISPYATETRVDALGNLLAYKKGRKSAPVRLMLSAHMDEVGLLITHITEEGLLRFAPVGGIDKRVLCGRRVQVGGHVGVIGAKPIHLLKSEERGKAVPMDEMFIDIGASSREEAQEAVSPGDAAGFVSPFDTSGGRIRGRALDDRAGCALLMEMLREELPYDMTFVFCVQEEVGLRGSKTAAFAVEPQAAIVVETTTAADIAGVDEGEQVCRLGKGPVVSFMDRATIYDREYTRLAFALAKEQGIPCQAKEAVAGGNDAGAIHVSRGGVRTIAVSLPCRYLHSAAGMIHQEDFRAAGRLIPALAENIAGGAV